jgi:hypothetical protein
MESFEVLRRAIEAPGAKAVAASLKVSPSLVYKWSQPPADDDGGSGARNPLDRLMELVHITGDTGLVQWICQQVNGFFCPNQQSKEAPALDFLRASQQMMKTFSTLLETMSRSIEDDGRVDAAEAAHIREGWEALKVHTESFVVACERGMF